MYYLCIYIGEYEMENFTSVGKTVCILIDQESIVCYSNIDRDVTYEYLEAINISDYLPVDDTIDYRAMRHIVTIDKVNLDKAVYYLILIQLQPNYEYIDSLTGLHNRNYWEQWMSYMLRCTMPKRFTLIIIDIDNLKHLNDTKGHLIGDKAIRIVGQAIKENIRKQDIGIRSGGDEFFILLADTKESAAQKVIDRIRESIGKRCERENINIEISAGSAYADSMYELEKVIDMADSNLYKEKNGKKAQVKHIADELKDLKQKIEMLTDNINRKFVQESNVAVNNELLEISTKLDKLIMKYSKYRR